MNAVTVSIVVNALSFLLPHIGVNLGSDAVTTTVQTIILIVTGIVSIFTHKTVVTAARSAGVKGF